MALRSSVVLIFFLLIVLASSLASAHVPQFVEEGSSISTASIIDDPAKSQVVYTELSDGNIAHYYRFNMGEGERIKLSLHIPKIDVSKPNLVLMGPGLGSEGIAPSYIEIPDDSGFMVFEGEIPDLPFYEPFTPSKAYELVDVDMPAPADGEYYVAVYSTQGAGKYSIAVGYLEIFSLTEWISIPIDVIDIHLWEGQSLLLIFGPLLATIVAGSILFFRGGFPLSVFSLTGVSAGLLYVGGGLMTLLQMFIALIGSDSGLAFIVTFFIALISVILGILILKIVHRGHVGKGERITLVIVGIIGLFSWSGLVVGPLLAILSGLLPAK